MEKIKEQISILPIEQIARDTNFTKRQAKKITSMDYVASFMKCVFKGDISQANWTRELSREIGIPLSAQSLQNKVQIRHEEFARELLKQSVQHILNREVKRFEGCSFLESFKSAKVHDSTCIKLPKDLMELFPGSSSQKGSNSMARIQLSMDLLRGDYSKIAINSFRENDQSYAMTLAESAQEGEFHLFDLGYFKLDALEMISEKAHFLCRYTNVNVYKKGQSEPVDLVGHLKKIEKDGGTFWDANVKIGSKKKLPVRIVALKVPQKVAQERIRKAKNNRDKRMNYSKDYFYLLGWNIFFTNLDEERLPRKQILRIYGFRWRIEIVFKAWKSKLNFASLFNKQSYSLHSRGIIQLNLVLFTITFFLTRLYKELFNLVFEKTGRLLSMLKFAAFIKNNVEYLLNLYTNDIDNLIATLTYHYCYDKRKDRTNFVELLKLDIMNN